MEHLGVGGMVAQRGPDSPLRFTAGALRPDPFRVLKARVEWNSLPPMPHLPGARKPEATKRGLRFEAKVTRGLLAAHPSRFVAQLPLSFQTCSRRGRAIPDGLLLAECEPALCVVEIKSRHTADAWWQLERFYAPIVREAFRGFRVVLLEICGSYDPAIRLPKPVALLDRVSDVFSTRECFHSVLVTRDGMHV